MDTLDDAVGSIPVNHPVSTNAKAMIPLQFPFESMNISLPQRQCSESTFEAFFFIWPKLSYVITDLLPKFYGVRTHPNTSFIP